MISPAEFRHIGGEFELSATNLEFDIATNPVLPSFGLQYETWLDTGRSALAVIASHLARTAANSTVWLPAYCCESMVAPFLRKHLPVRFYSVGARLDRIDADPTPGDTLLFIHYFGFRNHTALGRLEGFRSGGVRVIEDCVHAALSTGIGAHGDYALTSLRKLLPQPDGALLSSREAIVVDVNTPDEAFVSARIVGKLWRGAGIPAETFLPLLEQSERRLADDSPRTMSWISCQLLSHCDLPTVAAQRRANFTDLWHGLTEIASHVGVEPLFPQLEIGEVPSGFPVIIKLGRRDLVRSHLAERAIFCPIHWKLAHLTVGAFPEEHSLSASMLTLPIDQRYDAIDMKVMLDVLSTLCGDYL